MSGTLDRQRGLARYVAERRRERALWAQRHAGLVIREERQAERVEEDARSAIDWLADHCGYPMQVDCVQAFVPRAQLWVIEDVLGSDGRPVGWRVHLGDQVWPVLATARCVRFAREFSGGSERERWWRPTLRVEQAHPKLRDELCCYSVMVCSADPAWVGDRVREDRAL